MTNLGWSLCPGMILKLRLSKTRSRTGDHILVRDMTSTQIILTDAGRSWTTPEGSVWLVPTARSTECGENVATRDSFVRYSHNRDRQTHKYKARSSNSLPCLACPVLIPHTQLVKMLTLVGKENRWDGITIMDVCLVGCVYRHLQSITSNPFPLYPQAHIMSCSLLSFFPTFCMIRQLHTTTSLPTA